MKRLSVVEGANSLAGRVQSLDMQLQRHRISFKQLLGLSWTSFLHTLVLGYNSLAFSASA